MVICFPIVLYYIGSKECKQYFWYKFGASTASLENTLANDSYSNTPGWQAKDYQNDYQDWTIARNPCPSGWRVPTRVEWDAVIHYNAQKHYVDGIVITGSTGWDIDDINNVIKLGDYLYLPAAGDRDSSNGLLGQRGYNGLYWSSSANDKANYMLFSSGTSTVYNLSNILQRRYGYSVRCVSAE
jgi:uncharacterized protein (TIGR02145 family)